MSGRHVLPVALLLTLASCVRHTPPQGGMPGTVTFEAFGTASANGAKAPGEWDSGDCTQFAVNLPGGGTETADICIRNDAQNLYSVVSYPRTVVDSMLLFGMSFFTAGTTTPGNAKKLDEYFIQGGTGGSFPFTDAYNPSPGASQPDFTDPGGTTDGQGALLTSGGMHVYELAHPLNSVDDAHDFSLNAGDTIQFCAGVTIGGVTTQFPSGCDSGAIVGLVKITSAPTGGTVYSWDFAGRVCGIRGVECPPAQSPDPPKHPCAEKPALCEKPKFQEAGMFLYCTIKPCAVHDELPRNCLVKFPCPVPPGGGSPPFYHLTFTGLNNDWDVVLVDREGGKVPHRIVPIEGGVVVSFQPDARRHMPGLIGDYVAMFVMRESGRTGVRYDVKARLDTSDRHFAPPQR